MPVATRRARAHVSALGLVAGVLFVAGLAAAQTPLAGTHWRAIELAGKPVPPQAGQRAAHLVFDANGRVAGSDGCNRVTGTYELAGEQLTFGAMAGTHMACADTSSTEQAFREAVSGATRLAIEGDRLVLSNAAGTRLGVFSAGSPAPDGSPRHPLAGTSWQLVRFQAGDGAVRTPPDRTRYTLAFDAADGVTARIDCNRGRGTWTSAGPNQIELGPLALTRAACPSGSLHDSIVKQWPYIRGYLIKDGHLFLSLMADGGIYEFEPVGAP